MDENRRVLVTGGTGFIGHHLIQRLLSDGYQVHAIIRRDSADMIDGVVRHVHDGTMSSMMSVLRDARPDVVFHLASLFLAAHRYEDVDRLVVSNVLFGTQLLESMVDVGCRRLINAGTAWQRSSGPTYDPVNLYAATKQAFEDIARYYVLRGVSTTTLAIHDTYGPGDVRRKVLPLLVETALSDDELDLSPGDQLLHMVYVDDVVEAFLVAWGLAEAEKQPGSERYYLPASPPLTLRQLAAAVEAVTGRTLRVHWGAQPYRDRQIMVPWTGETLPGWSASVSIEEGLSRMIAADRSRSHE